MTFQSAEKLEELLKGHILATENSSWQQRHGSCLALTCIIKQEPQIFNKFRNPLTQLVLTYLSDDKPQVRQVIYLFWKFLKVKGSM